MRFKDNNQYMPNSREAQARTTETTTTTTTTTRRAANKSANTAK